MFQMLRSGLLSIVAYAAVSRGVAYGGDKTAPFSMSVILLSSLTSVQEKSLCYSLRNP